MQITIGGVVDMSGLFIPPKMSLYAGFVLALFSGSALAADITLPSPVVPSAAVNGLSWTGLYGGVEFATGRYFDSATEYVTATGVPTDFNPAYNANGASFGAKIGADYQWNMLVAGVSAEIEDGTFKGVFNDFNIGAGHDLIRFQTTLLGRVGLAYDRFLVYGLGGVDFANIDTDYVYVPTNTTETFKNIRAGGVIGAGVEYAITNNWTLGLDYRYIDFGSVVHNSTVAFAGLSGSHKETADFVHLSLNYRF